MSPKKSTKKSKSLQNLNFTCPLNLINNTPLAHIISQVLSDGKNANYLNRPMINSFNI